MQQNDLASRCILYPKAFVSQSVFAPEAFFQFSQVGAAESHYALSVASRFILRTIDNAHEYGCRTAERINTGFERRAGRAPDASERTHYLGLWDLRAGAIRSIELDCYRIQLRAFPEHGEKAHFQVELILANSNASSKARKKDRRVARTSLTMCLEGPAQRHVCDCDTEIAEELSAIEVSIEAPGAS
jgi:hypothetical protein